MTISFPSDAEIAEELVQYPAASLADALEEMVTQYLCFQTEEGYSEENYAYRKSCYYQSYYPYTHAAPWWKRIYWRFKKVDHPLFTEQTSLEEAARFFIWMGRLPLHTKLSNGEARAFGYALPREPCDKPVLVPIDVWGSDMSSSGIDWKKSAINENGLSFCAVQIVYAEDYELTPDSELTPDNSPKKTQCKRKSSMIERLDAVVNSLSNEITTSDRTIYYKMIKKKFFETYPETPKDIRGLGAEYLRQALERLETKRQLK